MSNHFICGLHPAAALSNATYHALDAVGKSDFDLIARSPAHYRFAEREETEAMKIGSAVHCAVLEPARFERDYAVMPALDRRTKAGKEQWAEFEGANVGKTLLSLEEGRMTFQIAAAVRAHPTAQVLLSAGQPEVSALWIDPELGVRCRARFDWLTYEGLIVDLKTTQNASTAAFAKSAATFRYHVQCAWYLEGYHRATGDLPLGFVFIAVEKTPPYAVALYELDSDAVEYGRLLARRDLARYATAQDLDVWPCYPDAIQALSLPNWAFNATLED